MNICTCDFREQMTARIRSLGENELGEAQHGIALLFQGEQQPCCLLTFLFYYAYCKECNVPLSEEARAVLQPLVHSSKGEEQKERLCSEG